MTGKRWTPEEDDIIKHHHKGRTSDEIAELLPGRSKLSIQKRGYDMGLQFAKPPAYAPPVKIGHPWKKPWPEQGDKHDPQ